MTSSIRISSVPEVDPRHDAAAAEAPTPPVAHRLRADHRGWRRLVTGRLDTLVGGRIRLRDGDGDRLCGRARDGEFGTVTLDVIDPAFYRQVAVGGSLGAAESFMAGAWTCDDLTTLLRLFARHIPASDRLERGAARVTSPIRRAAHVLHRNTRRGSRRNIHAHYDLGNDFFRLFLDETMTYSCGIFETPHRTMRDASIAKLDRLCQQLELRPEHHLLEIGSGWGSMAIHAARLYGCRVTTTTISREQHALASERVAAAGLEDRVAVLLRDYRDLSGTFDRLVSIEMIEAVGHRFLPAYFQQCADRLTDDGRMALQVITMPDDRYERYRRSVDFIQRYVFPGSCVPSLNAMRDAWTRTSDLRMTGSEDLTPHYVTTLQRWRDRFRANEAPIRALGCDDRFLRLWEFYLAYCEAGFAERAIGNMQIVLSKPADRGIAT